MKPHSELKRAYFNLIEIVLAMGILTIGLMGTLGLFSVGLNANRESIGRNYSADAGDEILHQLAASLKNDWALESNFSEKPPNISSGADAISTWTAIPASAGNLYEKTYSGDTVYRVQQTSNSASAVVDFDAMVRVWKAPSMAWEYDPDAGSWDEVEDTAYERRMLLHVEMSWPSSVPFHARQKAYFTMEVAKDND